ncbi:hypothetical protein EVAR_59815_1 [Eumeta japonica]|uniref:Uncharacterized protein n=1 Tax=Eumeta variegata TaxID=151549 RepID=A0A4C1YBA9_EUMVA|nr:hypothetical protein EVAR_59815_1 [Eumeta japonica]
MQIAKRATKSGVRGARGAGGGGRRSSRSEVAIGRPTCPLLPVNQTKNTGGMRWPFYSISSPVDSENHESLKINSSGFDHLASTRRRYSRCALGIPIFNHRHLRCADEKLTRKRAQSIGASECRAVDMRRVTAGPLCRHEITGRGIDVRPHGDGVFFISAFARH